MLDAVCSDFARIAGVEVVSGPVSLAANGDHTLVIAPECNGMLERLSQVVLDAGGHLLGAAPSAIRLTADKFAMADFWRRRGVATPATLDAREIPDFASPWVLKPRDGAGSQATYLVADRAGLKQALAAARTEWQNDLILQQFIAGQAASVALIVGGNETIALAPTWQTLSRDGRFHYHGGRLPMAGEFGERAIRLARRAIAGIDGLRGYVGMDMVLGDNGDDHAIEINPRLTTSYLGLRQLCRENLAELILEAARGRPLKAPTWRDGTVEWNV